MGQTRFVRAGMLKTRLEVCVGVRYILDHVRNAKAQATCHMLHKSHQVTCKVHQNTEHNRI